MEFTGDGVVIEKPANALDRLILDVASILDAVGVRYVVVSGYVAVLFGRARATEDIDVITERFDRATADELAAALQSAGYWGPAMPLDDLYETVADDLPVRIAEVDHRVPTIELKFASGSADLASLHNPVTVRLPDGSLQIGPLELQIAYKLNMGAQRDFEDALYLYETVGSNLNTGALESYVRELDVEDAYDRLRSA